MLSSLVFSIAMVFLFQALAGMGILASRTRRLRPVLVSITVVATVAALAAGQLLVFLWFVGAFLGGWIAWKQVCAGAGLWKTAGVVLIPVVLASAAPWLVAPTGELEASFREQIETWAGAQSPTAPNAGPSEQDLAERQRQLAQEASTWMIRLLPAEVVVFNLLQILPVVFAVGWLRRRSGSPECIQPISQWRVSFHCVWILACGLALVVTRSNTLTVLGMNLLLVGFSLLMVQGFAVILAVLERRVPMMLRMLMLSLAALTALPLLVVCAVFIGGIDLWVDLRRPRLASQDS